MGGTGLRASTVVDLHDVRVAGVLMLAVAAIAPSLPGHPGISCPLRPITGIPCPLCGMTTSVTALVHLHPGRAAAANPAGFETWHDKFAASLVVPTADYPVAAWPG